MLNHEGHVTECTADNIFIVKGGELLTPTIYDGILEGVTRDTILMLARREKIPAREQTLTRHDLYVADECFLTGTGAEVVAVTKIDGRPIADGMPGPITRKLTEAFHRYVREG